MYDARKCWILFYGNGNKPVKSVRSGQVCWRLIHNNTCSKQQQHTGRDRARGELGREKKNLKVNPAKYKEVVFYDKHHKENAQLPPPLPGIERVMTVKILGVTITNNLSVAEHLHSTISSCAQTLYALRVLRSHGMNDPALHTVFRTVVISKQQYASSAWWRFSTAAERQRIDALNPSLCTLSVCSTWPATVWKSLRHSRWRTVQEYNN